MALERFEDERSPNGRKQPRTLIEYACERLRHDIVSGKLEPGARLRVEVLKDVYGVGASTLREALSLLIADALVTAEGQRGFRIAPMSMGDLRDLTDLRKLLENAALRVSLTDGDDEWEAGVVAAYHRLSLIEERVYDDPLTLGPEWEDRNRTFHEALIGASHSRWLKHFRAILYQQSERYRRLALLSYRTLSRNVHDEHKAIMEAVLARDVDRACALMDDHLERTFVLLQAAVAQEEQTNGGQVDGFAVLLARHQAQSQSDPAPVAPPVRIAQV